MGLHEVPCHKSFFAVLFVSHALRRFVGAIVDIVPERNELFFALMK